MEHKEPFHGNKWFAFNATIYNADDILNSFLILYQQKKGNFSVGRNESFRNPHSDIQKPMNQKINNVSEKWANQGQKHFVHYKCQNIKGVRFQVNFSTIRYYISHQSQNIPM